MYRTIALTGATAAVIIGAGTAAIATSGSSGSTTAGHAAVAAATTARGAAAAGTRLGQLLRRTVHAQVVARGQDGTFVTHDEIRGKVDAVSPTSITVTAADSTVETYVVDTATKVRVRSGGKGAAAAIGSVHVGDGVIVLGTGSGTMTATHIVDGIAN